MKGEKCGKPITGQDPDHHKCDWFEERVEKNKQARAKLLKINELVRVELRWATEKFDKFNSPHEGWAIIREEDDELWDEVKANNLYKSCDEAIQVAAMAMRYLFDLMPDDFQPDDAGIRSGKGPRD